MNSCTQSGREITYYNRSMKKMLNLLQNVNQPDLWLETQAFPNSAAKILQILPWEKVSVEMCQPKFTQIPTRKTQTICKLVKWSFFMMLSTTSGVYTSLAYTPYDFQWVETREEKLELICQQKKSSFSIEGHATSRCKVLPSLWARHFSVARLISH